jgi:hypothetical protein
MKEQSGPTLPLLQKYSSLETIEPSSSSLNKDRQFSKFNTLQSNSELANFLKSHPEKSTFTSFATGFLLRKRSKPRSLTCDIYEKLCKTRDPPKTSEGSNRETYSTGPSSKTELKHVVTTIKSPTTAFPHLAPSISLQRLLEKEKSRIEHNLSERLIKIKELKETDPGAGKSKVKKTKKKLGKKKNKKKGKKHTNVVTKA